MFRSTPVSKCLDKKLKVLGFEVPDLLLIFFTLSVLNFILGPLGMRFTLVFLPTAILAVTLRIMKRGKPDNYLIHLAKFLSLPKTFSAFHSSSKFIEKGSRGEKFSRKSSRSLWL